MELKKPKIVEKPWGREIWIAHEKEYAGKILEIKKGFNTSLHYHDEKKETMYILEGKLTILHHDGEITLKEGEAITLNPRDVHRLSADTEDVKILEVSTPYLKDVVRVMDDYGRK